MAYSADRKPGELTALTVLATDDVFVVGDTSDASEVAKYITKANLKTDLFNTPTLVTPVLGAATGTSLQLSGLTASEIVITDASKNLASAPVATYPSLTELSHVKGVTSAVQTQLNAKGVGTWTDTSTSTGTNKTLNDHTNTIEADTLHIQVRNTSGATLAKGDAVYVSGYNVGLDLVEVGLADADDPTKMPAIGLIEANIVNNATGSIDASGRISGVVTNAYSVGDFLYISTTGTTGNTLTATKPTGATSQIQKIGEVLRSHATLGVIQVIGSGRSNDFPNYHTDDRFRIADNTDTTKLVDFQVSGVTTGTTRTLTVPDASGTLLLSGGALGTPSSGTLTNCTGLPVNGIVDDTSSALGVGTLELGAASDTTLAREAAGIISVENEIINGYASTATAAGTTTLTRASAKIQAFTGTTTQTVTLPTTGIVAGQQYEIQNVCTSQAGVVTVQSSGANTVLILGYANSAIFTAVQATPTTAAHWRFQKLGKNNVRTATSYTTDTGTSLNCDYFDGFHVTAQAGALLFNAPTGTPVDGQSLIITVASSTTVARALTYNAIFEASTVALPTTTAATTAQLNIGFRYSVGKTKWVCLATC